MSDIGRLIWRYKQLSAVFLLLAVAYVIQSLVTPIPAATLQKYHVTTGQLRELVMAIALPYIIIWGIALVGYLRLKSYTDSLGRSNDGKAFRLIKKGVFWFTIWLPLSTLISAVGEYVIRTNTALTADVIRTEVYANLLIFLPAFWYIFIGSKALLRVSRTKLTNMPEWLTWAYLAFAAFYTYLTLHDSARRVAPDAASYATYYLSDWVIVVTIVIPRLILWFMGIQAIYNIVVYRQKVAGVIYRQALKRLAIGLGGIVGLVIVLRCIQSLTNPLSKLNLAALLLVIYLLLGMMCVGYILLAKGAKHLQAIEES